MTPKLNYKHDKYILTGEGNLADWAHFYKYYRTLGIYACPPSLWELKNFKELTPHRQTQLGFPEYNSLLDDPIIKKFATIHHIGNPSREHSSTWSLEKTIKKISDQPSYDLNK